MKQKEHGIKHNRSQSLIDAAYRFAKLAHGDQKRKYTDEPYINHPVAVAKIVAGVTEDCEMICAALLHDVLEDTDKTYQDLIDYGFGAGIANLVVELTDVSKPEDGNRAIRKTLDKDHLAGASSKAQTVKLADLIDNSHSIIKYDSGFAKIFMGEIAELLVVLSKGDYSLWSDAEAIVRKYYSGK